MKYITFLFLILFLSFTGCNKDNDSLLEKEKQEGVDYSDNNKDKDSDDKDSSDNDKKEYDNMILTINNTTLEIEEAKNSSVDSLREVLKKGPITIQMNDYESMEKVGSLGQSFPRNDTQITTEAGDVILYQGNMLVIYYAQNTWSFTRLGKIKNVSADDLKTLLGDGNVTVVLSLSTKQ